MSRTENFTSVLYNTLKHNTALWRYLDRGECSVIIYDNDKWAVEYNTISGYGEHMNDHIYDQLNWVMEYVFNKNSIYGLWHVDKDKFSKDKLMIKGE